MNATHMKRSLAVLASLAVAALVAHGTASIAAEPVNLLANAGMESWEPIKDSPIANALTWGPNGGPAGWDVAPEIVKADNPNAEFGGSIIRDSAVKHSGQYSVRLSCAATTDILAIVQRVPVDPSAKYRVHGWYRCENVKPWQLGGIWIWINTIPNLFEYSTYTWRHHETADGPTFDWREFNFTESTGPSDHLLELCLQLRRAPGTVWFDDVSVTRVAN